MTLTGTDAPKVPAPRQILSTTIYMLELAIVALIYIGLASTAPLFPALNAIATPLWPPSGVALAIMLLRGDRIWPAVFIGSFSASAISIGAVEIQSLAIAGGTTLGALLGTRLINYWSGGTKTLSNPHGVAKFVFIAFIPTALISAVAASASGLFADEFNYSTLLASASSWWLADAAASIAIAPVILLWATTPLWGISKTDLLKTADNRRFYQCSAAPRAFCISHFAAVNVGCRR